MAGIVGFLAACAIAGVALSPICRFFVLIPATGLAVLWIVSASPGLSWPAFGLLVAVSTAALQAGYVIGSTISELLPAQLRRSILPDPSSKPI